MMHFTTSPVLIALMQTATMLPVFLVGLLAGTLADIVNRRPLLLATEGLMNAPLLLGFTFVIGLGPYWGTQPGRRSTPNWSRPTSCPRP